jgi:hypothetical protein
MTVEGFDLVVLVPGRDEWETVNTLLYSRSESLGLRRLTYKIVIHPRRDPGCFNEAPALLEVFRFQASRCLVLLDHEGSGQDDRPKQEVEADLLTRLSAAGWQERAGVVVIAPELEIWIWSDSPHVETELGWKRGNLRGWLRDQGWWPEGQAKPNRPKEAMDRTLKEIQIRRSPAIYGKIASKVGLKSCQDESFRAFRELLVSWFPRET